MNICYEKTKMQQNSIEYCMPSKLNIDIFVDRARQIHNNYYDYSQFVYTNWDTKSNIICHIHGIFSQSPRLHIERKSGCKKCGHKKQAISKSITKEEFISRSIEIHGHKYNYTNIEYLGFTQPITIICDIHGKFRFEHAYAHIINKNGCTVCARELHRSTTDDFINKSQKLFPNLFQYSNTKYSTVHNPLLIYCNTHGEQLITPADHYRIGCWLCKRNRYQDIWLDSIGIPNSKQTRQVRLIINNKLYIVDGFNPNTKQVYLFHGDYWHGNPILYESTSLNTRVGKTFGELYQSTLEYEQTLCNNGYTVYSIWEYEWLQHSSATSVVDL